MMTAVILAALAAGAASAQNPDPQFAPDASDIAPTSISTVPPTSTSTNTVQTSTFPPVGLSTGGTNVQFSTAPGIGFGTTTVPTPGLNTGTTIETLEPGGMQPQRRQRPLRSWPP